MILLQLSSAQGPDECCLAVKKALDCLRRGDLFKITVIRCDLAESVVIQGDRRKRLSR